MGPVQRQVLGDHVAFTDEVMLLDGNRPEVVLNGAQDPLQPLATLETGGVIHHVRGNEIIKRGVVTGLLSSIHLLDDLLRTALAHNDTLGPASNSGGPPA